MAIAAPLVAAAMSVVAALATVPMLVADGASVDAFHGDVLVTVGGLLVASSLLGAIGVLLGLIVRSQVAAVVAVLTWALVLEGIVDVVVGGGLRRWLPGGAAADLAGGGGQPMWSAAAVVSAWAIVLAIIAVPAVVRRDVS